MYIILGLFIPFIGTILGASMVFFIKHQLNSYLQKALLGFASGVMVAASVWSLLIPAMELSKNLDKLAFIPAAAGLLLGVMFLLLLDENVPHLHLEATKPEGKKSNLKKTTMMMLAVTMHNIPEGMAVGVVLAGYLTSNSYLSLTSALALSIGIAIQNFPEGAIISLPLRNEKISRIKAFVYGMLSGIVEPISGIITIILSQFITPLLPYLLSFAAGAMLYVVVEELIPESNIGEHSNIGTIGFSLGFVLMMILDIALG